MRSSSPTPGQHSSTSIGGAVVVDWSYAQRELLQQTGYDITKELEEKEKKFVEKEREFETR